MKVSSRSAALILAGCLLAPAAAMAVFNAPDYGGTTRLPNGGYVSPADVHAWLHATGGNVSAELRAHHAGFGLLVVRPGGILNGQIETYASTLTFTIIGHGDLEGWSRTVVVPANCETHLAPRKVGDPVQSFDTNMYRIEGGVTGDPDFDYFEVVAGTGNGLDSPGHTTLTRQADGSWLVDSSFDIHYQIKYKGAKGGKFDGIEDVAEGIIKMNAVPADPSQEPKQAAATTK